MASAFNSKQTAYALDSTTIDLCLKLFPWAQFRRRKGAIKLHTLIDLRGNIPCFVRITHGKTHDVTVLDTLPIEPGAFYVMDRALSRFRPTLSLEVGLGILRDSGQEQPRLQPTLVPPRGQDHGIAQRPNDRPLRPEDIEALPRSLASRGLPRPQDGQAVRVLDQQLRFASIDNCEHLPNVAGRSSCSFDGSSNI